MDADDLFIRRRLDAQGIGVAELRFIDEGELMEILDGLDLGDAELLIDLREIIVGFEDRLQTIVDQRELLFCDLHDIPPMLRRSCLP